MTESNDISKEIVEALDDFLAKLKNEEPIEATELRRIETEDGPMFVNKKTIL